VILSALAAAEKHGRAVCAMYDLSGMSAGDATILIEDWKKLSATYRLTESSNYLHHNGKPLVAIWGVGFSKAGRKYGFEDVWKVVDFLRGEGCSILLGVPTSWRTLNNDAVADKQLHDVILKADIVQPWLVGRFKEVTPEHGKRIAQDMAWCEQHDKDYLPVLFPGFSWHNMRRGEQPLNSTPRRGGQFFWDQAASAVGAGAKCLYLAMFDEMDEGTAFFKVTNDPPVGASPFATYEGQPSDHYLWLAGQAARMLRGDISVSKTIPARE
jgi:hypothetical protein